MKTVYFDIDTQQDFLLPAGALYVPGAERIIPVVAELNRQAAAEGIPVISTMDAHAENDPEFAQWPAHCVAGTLGQRKPAETLLEKRIVIPSSPVDVSVEGYQQILLEKQHLNCFTNPNLLRILDALGAQRCVVYGVVTEYCVREAVLGLLRTGRAVEVETRAIQALNEQDGARALEEMARAGAVVR
jgi:nicotinamidase/pyrazinamidase